MDPFTMAFLGAPLLDGLGGGGGSPPITSSAGTGPVSSGDQNVGGSSGVFGAAATQSLRKSPWIIVAVVALVGLVIVAIVPRR